MGTDNKMEIYRKCNEEHMTGILINRISRSCIFVCVAVKDTALALQMLYSRQQCRCELDI